MALQDLAGRMHITSMQRGDSLLANTVQQIYDPAAGYALYNDERPNGTVSFHLAHAKGTPPPLLVTDCPY